MQAENNSYKQILKATSLFGGVQVVSILVSIIKTKVAALLIGVSGVGIFGILMSTLNFVQALTRCGLDLTAVKEIASSSKDEKPKLISVIKQLALITGVAGAIVILMSSSWLSQLAFSNKTYTLFFITISIAVLFNQLAICDMAILQGLKSIKKLAKVIAFSSLISLLPTISIYYFFGENGIPWVIVSTAVISFITAKFFMNKLNLKTTRIPFKQFVESSADVLKPGIHLSLASIIALAIAYIVQIFITNYGSIEEVGLYNAGFAIIHSYVAVFFSALSKDFFPRLSEVSKNRTMVNKIVNEQAYMLLLLMTPIVIIFLVIKPFIVTLLYSKDFLPILGMITYGILATAFKSISWSMGFILIAKGDSRLYLITEVISNFLLLISIIIGYNIYGLTGLGVGYLVYHIIDFLFIKIIVSKKYNFHFNSNFNKLFYICTLQFIIITGLFYIEDEIIKNTSLVLLILFSLSFAIYRLNNHFSLIKLLIRKLKK